MFARHRVADLYPCRNSRARARVAVRMRHPAHTTRHARQRLTVQAHPGASVTAPPEYARPRDGTAARISSAPALRRDRLAETYVSASDPGAVFPLIVQVTGARFSPLWVSRRWVSEFVDRGGSPSALSPLFAHVKFFKKSSCINFA